MATRVEQLADAYESVARINHYMVGIIEDVTEDERDGAFQILVDRQNASTEGDEDWQRIDFALDLIELHMPTR